MLILFKKKKLCSTTKVFKFLLEILSLNMNLCQHMWINLFWNIKESLTSLKRRDCVSLKVKFSYADTLSNQSLQNSWEHWRLYSSCFLILYSRKWLLKSILSVKLNKENPLNKSWNLILLKNSCNKDNLIINNSNKNIKSYYWYSRTFYQKKKKNKKF